MLVRQESCTGDGGTGLSNTSSRRAMRTGGKQKLGCGRLDKTKPEKLVTQEKLNARSYRKWLEPKWYGLKNESFVDQVGPLGAQPVDDVNRNSVKMCMLHFLCEEVVQPESQTVFLAAKWHRAYS